MTEILSQPQPAGGVRVLILGGGAYPQAQTPDPKRPTLPDISSASLTVAAIAEQVLGAWHNLFQLPVSSVDLLANSPDEPGGLTVKDAFGHAVTVEPPTMANIKAAKTRWLKNAQPQDILIFYCCGHGIWLPSASRLFLATDFGSDPDSPWSTAVALDDFALGLTEKMPRSQWLIFDCCANVPSEALRALAARPEPLITATIGTRQQIEQQHGPLSQVVLASAPQGAQAFGRDQRPSRFAEAFLEACDDSAFVTNEGGKWWVDSAALERAISSYAVRIASAADKAYFTFPTVTKTDALGPVKLLKRDHPARCTLVVTSSPSDTLLHGDLLVTERGTTNVLAAQTAGAASASPLRVDVPLWKTFDARLVHGNSAFTTEGFTAPPLATAELGL